MDQSVFSLSHHRYYFLDLGSCITAVCQPYFEENGKRIFSPVTGNSVWYCGHHNKLTKENMSDK